ncbi:hypothetical protein JXO52_09455 [bacterium]|nr:hypothetical protein [bacterium]
MKKSIILLIMLVLTASLTAQQTVTLDWMLSLEEELGLSEAQVQQIQDLDSDLQKRCIKIEANYKLAEVELDDLKRDPAKNLKAIEKKYHDLASLKADREFAPVKAGVEAEALLTPEQRTLYKKLRNPFHALAFQKDAPAKENVFFHEDGDGKVWIEGGKTADVPRAVYEFNTQDGKGAVWQVKKKTGRDEAGTIIVECEKDSLAGKEMKYDVYVTADNDGEKTVRILKKIGEGDEITAEKIILEDVDIDEITAAETGEGGKKMIKVRIREGDEHHAPASIKEIEDEDLKKILEEHPGESIMIIKHADGRTEVIKDLKAIEEKEAALKAASGDREEGMKVIVKKVEKEEKK